MCRAARCARTDLARGSHIDWYSIDDAGLTGAVSSEIDITLTDSSVSYISLKNNRLGNPEGSETYGLGGGGRGEIALNSIVLRGNSDIGHTLSFDLFSQAFTTVDLSDTGAAFCYSGAGIANPRLLSLSVRNVRPSPFCNRLLDSRVTSSVFRACTAAAAANQTSTSLAINDALCIQSTQRLVFAESGLSCPAWSTISSSGKAVLDVDAAFLSFWGCSCPDGYYWGYTGADAMAELQREARQMTSVSSLGANESALLQRRCLPCPASVRCNSLAAVDAPHEVVGSQYPLLHAAFGGRLLRRLLVNAIGFAPCLHPAVCNKPLAIAVSDWAEWAALMANGTVGSPAMSEYMSRDGHDPSSLMCSRCLPNFYLNGFLW
jgi:hypothetical protein